MRAAKHLPVLGLVLLTAAACRTDGTGPGGPSWFRASLTGEVAREYEGTGDFASLRDFAESPRYFMIFSKSEEGQLRESFYFRWPNARRPAAGTYELVPHEDQWGSSRGVTGLYAWRQGDNVTEPAHGELYVATGGVVEITRSTPEEVEGKIRFSGTMVLKSGPWGTEVDDPRYRPNPESPTVEVSGTFRAIWFDESAQKVKAY